MGPSVYPPARGSVQNVYTPSYQFPNGSNYFKGEFGRYYNSQWTLPPAMLSTGAMLVLPSDPGLWPDVISRWESITINRLNDTTWSDNKAKLTFVENSLGENEKKMWQQWRTTYPEAYTSLEAMADDPQNITSQMRQIILMEDPYRGSTEEQDRAYRDLERLTCENTKDLWKFLNEFRILACKSGRLFFPATTDKFFTKLPPVLSKKIEEAFKNKYPGLTAGILPAIKFTHTYITEMCTEAALQKELRDLSLCSAIPIPGYYKSGKKYGVRKSRSYKGKPHKTHVKVFKRKYKDDRGRVGKCKCYICGREGHFARDCRSQTGNMARRAVVDNLDLKEDWDIVSADVSDQDTIYSISEGEGGSTLMNIGAMVEESPLDENAFILTQEEEEFCFMFHPENQDDIHRRVQEAGSWRPNKELPEQSKNCVHGWQENEVTNYTFCHFCGIATTDMSRLHCPKCKLTSCALCAPYYLKRTVSVKKNKETEIMQKEEQISPMWKMLIQKDNEWKQAIMGSAKEAAEWRIKEQELKNLLEEEKRRAQKEKENWAKEKQILMKDLDEMLKVTESMKVQIQHQTMDQSIWKKAIESQLKLQWKAQKTRMETKIKELQQENEYLKGKQEKFKTNCYQDRSFVVTIKVAKGCSNCNSYTPS